MSHTALLFPGLFEIIQINSGKIFVGVTKDVNRVSDDHALMLVRFAHPCKQLQAAFDRAPMARSKLFTQVDRLFGMNIQRSKSLEQSQSTAAGLAQAYHNRGILLNPGDFKLTTNKQREMADV